jgi:hypothetical protein
VCVRMTIIPLLHKIFVCVSVVVFFFYQVQVQHALLDADMLYYLLLLYMRTDACFVHEGEAQHWDFGSWKATDPKRRGRLMRRWSCCPDFKVLRLC